MGEEGDTGAGRYRREDGPLLRGAGRFTDNVEVPGALRAAFVRATSAHARLQALDVTAARAAPGVVAVYTAADVDLGPLPPPALFPDIDQRFGRSPLAVDTVRFVGEPVAVVVATDAYRAADAAALVEVDEDPLPPVIDVEAAVAGEVLLFPEIGTNVVGGHGTPLPGDLHERAEVVVRRRIVNQRIAPAPMEPRVCAAEWDGGRLTFHVSTQGVVVARNQLAARLGLDPEAVRVVATDVGGGFGSKGLLSPEELLVGWLARRVGRPVRWTETRSESLVAMPHGRGQTQEVTIGATAEGRFVSLGIEVLQDAGAYPEFGAGLPNMTRTMSAGPYRFERVGFHSRSVLTNTTPLGAFRGAGRPEAAHAIEQAVDALARRLGMDPVALRRKNLLRPEDFPYHAPSGAVYDTGDYHAALDAAVVAAGYDDLRAEQARRRHEARRRDEPDQARRRDEAERARRRGGAEQAHPPCNTGRRLLGIGVASYVEVTGTMRGEETARVHVAPDGRVTVGAGSTPHGQGHHTVWAQLAAEILGVAADDVEVITGDTDLAPPGQVTGGSRSGQSCAVVITRAAHEVVRLGRERAALLLEAAVDDVTFDVRRACFHVSGAPALSRGWAEVAAAGPEPLGAEQRFERTAPTFPFGAHVAVVEVDADTGGVTLVRLVACDDAGRRLHRTIVEGQIHGGLAQGAAQALAEGVVYDPHGNPLTATFADYPLPSAAELPSFELVDMVTPTTLNELGTKGIGESGVIGSTPAVLSAVIDALAHLGVDDLAMPVTPERVWAAIAAAPSARSAIAAAPSATSAIGHAGGS